MHSRPLVIASEPSVRNLVRSTSMCWITRTPMQQRASESIGALAAALAKAQIELVNPEKSLVATIREEGRHGREQRFRYAPLSAGLEITRKVLGQYEIATLQTQSERRIHRPAVPRPPSRRSSLRRRSRMVERSRDRCAR